jgi:ankyrin repeat protein
MVKQLVQHGADIHYGDGMAKPPLIEAALHSSRPLVYIILKGVKVNVPSDCGTTLHCVSWQGNIKVAQFLPDNRADISLRV